MERISHYEIVRRLGQGGMGEVFEATDLDLGRRVALKFVAAHYASSPDALRRFEREARVAAALHHPGIATLFAFDRSTDRPFLVMEFLGGRTLRDALRDGPLEVADALGIARVVADALAYAHRHEVVHRDIKPENLMFDAEGAIKITDFGLARLADASQLTVTGSILGTPSYMAPELVEGGVPSSGPDATAESSPADVFALGVTLYEMLTRTLPFRGQTPLATLYSIANNPLQPVRELRPEVPIEAEALLERMLQKRPELRPSASEAANLLAVLTGVTPAAGWAVGAASGGASGELADTTSVTYPVGRRPDAVAGQERPVTTPTAAPSRRGRGAWARPLVMVTLAGAVLALAYWGTVAIRQRPDPRAVALNNEGHDSLAAGNWRSARLRFEAALAVAPRYAVAKLNLATVLARGVDVNRAAALFGEVILESPRRADLQAAAHYGLGEIDLQARAWPSAISHLREATRRDSSRVEYPNNLAYALIQSGRTTEALALLGLAQRRFPGEPALLKNAALAWYASGQFDSALVVADRCLRIRPTFATAWLVKLEAEAARGDRAAAHASLDALRRLAPDAATLTEAESALRETPAPARTPHE